MGDFDISQINNASEQESPKNKRNFSSIVKKGLIIFSLIFVVISAIFIYSYKYRNRSDDITIGYSSEEDIALVSIAENLKYFADKEVEIDYRNYDDELELIQALSESKVDVVFVEDLSIVMANPAENKNKIITSVLNAEKYFFVVDVKKGVFDVSSLSGQELGVPDSYKTDYWLAKGLINAGIDKRDVIIETYKPEKLAEELANAEVTGIFAWQPYVYESETFEGSEVQQIVLPIQREEQSYTYLLTSESYLENNAEDLKKLVLSLISAEQYIVENNDISVEYLAGEWSSEKRYVTEILNSYNYEVNISRESKLSLSEKYEWSKTKSRSQDEEFQIESIYYYNLLREIDPKRAEF